jgi:uncharacterized protein (DUF2267 family)
MAVKTHAPFETTFQTTNVWLKELKEELGSHDPQQAYHAYRAVLHALRDLLTVSEVADLGAQLPMLLRGLYYEGWNPGKTHSGERKKEAFLRHIGSEFRADPALFPENVAWAVFKILKKHVSAGEIKDVKHVLPAEIRSLWPRDGE